jgi:hypothetical protein
MKNFRKKTCFFLYKKVGGEEYFFDMFSLEHYYTQDCIEFLHP